MICMLCINTEQQITENVTHYSHFFNRRLTLLHTWFGYMQRHAWVSIIMKPDVCVWVLYLLEGHFASQCKLLLSGVGCVNG